MSNWDVPNWDTFETRLNALVQRLVQLEKQMAGMQVEVRMDVEDWRKARATDGAHYERMNDLQAQINANDANLTQWKSIVGAYSGQLGALEEEVSDLTRRFEKSRSEGFALSSSLSRRVSALEDATRNFAVAPNRADQPIPHPLPKWSACTVVRGANWVGVYEADTIPDDSMIYSFDDFEAAGRFVAAVLTQGK